LYLDQTADAAKVQFAAGITDDVSEEIFVIRTTFWYDEIAYFSEYFADLDKSEHWVQIARTTKGICAM